MQKQMATTMHNAIKRMGLSILATLLLGARRVVPTGSPEICILQGRKESAQRSICGKGQVLGPIEPDFSFTIYGRITNA